MCVHQKGDPKLLSKLPLSTSGSQPLTNGISSPHHMTSSSEEPPSEPPVMEISADELREAFSCAAQDSVLLSTLDPKHLCLDLVKRYEIELERIDQQLLELGPYAQDAYDDEETQPASAPVVVSPPVAVVDGRRGRKGKQVASAASQKGGGRRASRGVVEEVGDPQRWKGGAGWAEIPSQRAEEEQPKKKWRKVGSAGPTVRGLEGQLDAHSDPLNVSSANLILTPTTELERRGIYQHSGGRRGSADAHMHTAQGGDRVGGATTPTGPPGAGVSTAGHSTPGCSTTPPGDLPGLVRAQPSAQWKPVTMASSSHARADTSEEIDVTRIDGEATPTNGPHLATSVPLQSKWREIPATEPHPPSHGHIQRDPHTPKPGYMSDPLMEANRMHPSSPQTTLISYHGAQPTDPAHGQLRPHPLTGGAKHTSFSISHLARGSETPPHSYDNHMTSYGDQRGGVPSPHGDLEGVARKRRTSSSSSHRSTRHSLDDAAAVRSGSPLSRGGQFLPGGVIWDGSAALSPGAKEQLAASQAAGEPGKTPSLPPFAMWPPGVPVPTDPAQLQRLSLSSPFLAASNPWLRSGIISGLPFRPALYPTGAAANSLDPANPYKSMLGLSLYPFSPGAIKAPFASPAFSAPPNSATNSQPQTPSAVSTSNPGFPFSQYPIQPGLGVSAATLREAQSRFPGQPLTTFPGDSKQRGSPDSNQETPQPWPMIPGVPMLQAPLGFGPQSPLPSSLSQPAALNLLAAQRGSTPFSTSPLTLVTQSALGGGAPGDVMEMMHTQGGGRRSKKQTPIDLTGREPVMRHLEAPSPQEAVKMATQRISPFQDPSRFSPKPKGMSEITSASSSSSPLMPSFGMNPGSLPPQGAVLSYPGLAPPPGGAHLVNPAQLMGVAVPGNHMIPMSYPPPTIQGVTGKSEEGATGKKRSPKRGAAAQKLRIHQMEFPQHAGKIDRRRRRPWKPQEKPDDTAGSSSVKPGANSQGKVAPVVGRDVQQTPASSEDTYALKMLADCSTKEGDTVASPRTATHSDKQVELAVKRAQMRSPGSIAGANSLLLLAKPDQPSSDQARPRDSTPAENAVVDGLLKLSNSSVPTSQEQSNFGIQKQSMATLEPGFHSTEDITLAKDPVSNPGPKKKVIPAALSLPGEKRTGEADSEKTDTDSEATLSPTTPAPSLSTNGLAEGGTTQQPLSHSLPHTTHLPSHSLPHTTHLPSHSLPHTSKDVPTDHHSQHQQSSAAASTTIIPTSEERENSTLDEKRESESLPMAATNSGQCQAVGDVVAKKETVGEGGLEQLQPAPPSTAILHTAEDDDIDVENIDTSLTEKPEKPVLEPSQELSLRPEVSLYPSVSSTSALAPEIFPTSPSAQEDESCALTPPEASTGSPSVEPDKDPVGVARGVASVGSPPVLSQLVGVVEPVSDELSPPKRLKLEKERDACVGEEGKRSDLAGAEAMKAASEPSEMMPVSSPVTRSVSPPSPEEDEMNIASPLQLHPSPTDSTLSTRQWVEPMKLFLTLQVAVKRIPTCRNPGELQHPCLPFLSLTLH